MDSEKALVAFEDKKIRRTWHNEEWYFSVVDITAILTDQPDSFKARKYWNKISQRLKEDGSEVVTNCRQLKLPAPDGKMRETDCANTEGIFRIIQSIPSPKADPFKCWLAKAGYEEFIPLDNTPLALSNRVKEIDKPELAQKRMKELYKAKGYSYNWIEKRVRGIAIRDEPNYLPMDIECYSMIGYNYQMQKIL
ncbi:MAG: hypothetical protein DRN66_02375 [Candidatus Nanohalarchaeota archaeon]|nr:MAG: hypothetical protein DRN66_02375 [Candidatus Nanohaloarchaeota archaeon]